MSDPLADLVTMSRTVGDPTLDLVILGEGNTSVRADADTFWVKGSGSQLSTIEAKHFVRLRFDRVLAMLDKETYTEAELNAAYEGAKAEHGDPKRPSVETVFHAVCLSIPGVNAVAHSHATAVNMLTVSTGWPQVLQGRLFPDEAVVLGLHSAFVPYIDPGVVLARAIRDAIADFGRQHSGYPRAIYMQNHGVIALGRNATEAVNISMMAAKAARIRLGAIQAGGLNLLPDATAQHIVNRPDEKYREAQLVGRK
jgi:rhamnose utilization protein RhaD (predicted bifunctional aldolase and dehydrogenase)